MEGSKKTHWTQPILLAIVTSLIKRRHILREVAAQQVGEISTYNVAL